MFDFDLFVFISAHQLINVISGKFFVSADG